MEALNKKWLFISSFPFSTQPYIEHLFHTKICTDLSRKHSSFIIYIYIYIDQLQTKSTISNLHKIKPYYRKKKQ